MLNLIYEIKREDELENIWSLTEYSAVTNIQLIKIYANVDFVISVYRDRAGIGL